MVNRVNSQPKGLQRLVFWIDPFHRARTVHTSEANVRFHSLRAGRSRNHFTAVRTLPVCSNLLGTLAAGARDDLAEQLPRRAVKFLKLHLLDRSEIVCGGVDGDARQ